MLFKGISHLHLTAVILFLLIYLIKTILLVTNKNEVLESFKKKTRILEMIVSTIFLLSGIYLLTQIPEIKPMMYVKILLVLASIPVAVVAYKKGNKVLAIASLMMIVFSYGLAEMSKKHSASNSQLITNSENLTDDEFSAKYGSELYLNDCKSCHGEDGKLGMSGAFDLSQSKLTKEEAVMVITNGRGMMRGMKDVYDVRKINAVADYIQSLKK
jgi:uncharacterized membrane protein SirB2